MGPVANMRTPWVAPDDTADECADWAPTPPVARAEFAHGWPPSSNLVMIEASPDGGGERRTFTVAGYACQEHAAEHARRINEALAWSWKVSP